MKKSDLRYSGRAALAGVLMVLGAVPASSAQPAPSAQDGPATIFIGASAIGPLSGTADRFSIGFGVDIGASYNINEQMSIRGDWVFGQFGQSGEWPEPPLPVVFDTSLRAQFATANFVFHGPPGRARLYVMAGVGVYFRRVDVTGSSTGQVEVCDPWWFVCTGGEVGAAQVLGTRSHTSIGVNVGVGVRFSRYFVEGRYHYAGGPTYDTPSGSQTATGKFFPVTFGVTF